MYFPLCNSVVMVHPSCAHESSPANAKSCLQRFPLLRLAKTFCTRWNNATSPGTISLGWAVFTTSVSPGQIVGSMLQPVTLMRRVPESRRDSAANSHLTACANVLCAAVMKPFYCRIGSYSGYRFSSSARLWLQTSVRSETKAFRTVSSVQPEYFDSSKNHS